MRKLSYRNVFRLHVHFHANQTRFHMKGFVQRLVLNQGEEQGNLEMEMAYSTWELRVRG